MPKKFINAYTGVFILRLLLNCKEVGSNYPPLQCHTSEELTFGALKSQGMIRKFYHLVTQLSYCVQEKPQMPDGVQHSFSQVAKTH